ncbi:MAG: ATP-dependent DNA helicase RecG [Eubacteriales bacterium]|nr:ATP-dependent DNA helicase RecG [Eubacteriales bacterium]
MFIEFTESGICRQSIDSLYGISAKRSQAFRRLGIEQVGDLLSHIPRAYIDWTEVTEIALLQAGQQATIEAEIISVSNIRRKGRLQWWQMEIADSSGTLVLTYFNQLWLRRDFIVGRKYFFNGKIEARGFFKSLVNPQFMKPEDWSTQALVPVYPATEGLSQNLIRKTVDQVLVCDELWLQLEDPLPRSMRERYQLAELSFAIKKIHQPRDREELNIARRRIAFAELFYLGAAMKLLKERRIQNESAPALDLDDEAKIYFKDIVDSLPFKPRAEQVQACNEIFADLRKTQPMSRLLQGDVGTGKTLVALLAMLYTVLAGAQTALLAPTSVLATQHQEKLSTLLAGTPYEPVLLTAATKGEERREILHKLASGEQKLVIGTHAVLADDVKFANLGLVVTDEQHRFGVKQRSQALEQIKRPHNLVMSATPIPRTLALILYADLDISRLHEKAGGRAKIDTYTVNSNDLDRVYDLIERRLQNKEQAYIVCPLLAESEEGELEAADVLYKELKQKRFKDYRLGLLHGRLKGEEKSEIILNFLAGAIDLLISTTVIEVGIDNPEASLILILNAERFGLAQLHQLRGRVGRGDYDSLCILHSDIAEGDARERLRFLCRADDGFEIAERDLKNRGPGQFFGERQHGLNEQQLVYALAEEEIIKAVDLALKEFNLNNPKIKSLIEMRYPDLRQGETL